ncbi:hypothetical protein SASPL_149161 [Salvia splendens]|uniref:Uncharacterized protein n=1 Tax=Salvia splendens TaxID=180675 RepID=A0A8X8Z440_SALSN|nr:hypothetical protein SASPL_149161 [Salvia splendens]
MTAILVSVRGKTDSVPWGKCQFPDQSYDNSHGATKQAAEALEMRIAHAAQVAEDVIESHMVDQIRGGKTRSCRFLLDLQKAIEGMDYMRRKALNVGARSERGHQQQQQ